MAVFFYYKLCNFARPKKRGAVHRNKFIGDFAVFLLRCRQQNIKNKGHSCVATSARFKIMETQNLILFAANLIFIVTSLYAWMLKWFYRPKAYRSAMDNLFPGRFACGLLFLFQIFEIPYLLNVGSANALLYINTFSLLLYPPFMLIICDSYFFPKRIHRKREYYIFIPAAVLVVPLLLQALHIVYLPYMCQQAITAAVYLTFAWYLFLTVRMALKIKNVVKGIDELEFSDSTDFPRHFAEYVMWVPLCVCIIYLVCFVCNDVWVKFARDILLSVVTTCFVFFTLDPWREIVFSLEERIFEEAVETKRKTRMSDSRFEQLKNKLLLLFEEKQIYLTPHLSLDMLLKELTTNRNYICETISRAGYKSFYDMVNSYRVKHAVKLIKENPDIKMIEVAYQCGFSSAASMNKAFTSQGLSTPSQYKDFTPPHWLLSDYISARCCCIFCVCPFQRLAA